MSIYITLDFSLGLLIVEKQLLETLQFLSGCLSLVIQSHVNKEKTKTTSDSLSHSKHMHDTQHVIKTLLALLSRFDQKLRTQFESIGNISVSDCSNKDKVFINKLVRDLLNGCSIICSDKNTFPSTLSEDLIINLFPSGGSSGNTNLVRF